MADVIDGINIQWPWSEEIASGRKTVETRGYRLPAKHIGRPLALIQTPGPNGRKNGIARAQIIAVVVFSGSFKYKSRNDWLMDRQRHCVHPEDATYGFDSAVEKWGWVVERVEILPTPQTAPSPRGIVFASNCKIRTSKALSQRSSTMENVQV